MRKELEKILVEKYPNLYSKYGGDIRETRMGWGMSCGDGWFRLLDELSAKLEPFSVVASQVKEKFGGLRFYLEPYSGAEEDYNKANAYISEAESNSYKICEVCGKPGSLKSGSWLRTTCDKCQSLISKGNVPWRNPELFDKVDPVG
jgi:hypothetical protein